MAAAASGGGSARRNRAAWRRTRLQELAPAARQVVEHFEVLLLHGGHAQEQAFEPPLQRGADLAPAAGARAQRDADVKVPAAGEWEEAPSWRRANWRLAASARRPASERSRNATRSSQGTLETRSRAAATAAPSSAALPSLRVAAAAASTSTTPANASRSKLVTACKRGRPGVGKRRRRAAGMSRA